MIDKSAIDRISELGARGRPQIATHVPCEVVPDGMSITSLEQFLERPLFMRQRFTTRRIDDFLRYVIDEADEEGSTVYVHPDGDSALAVIDHGTHTDPQWGRHQASLQLAKTPFYESLLAVTSERTRPLSQQDLIEWLEDWRMQLSAVIAGSGNDDDEPLPIARVIETIRKIEINKNSQSSHERGDYNAAMSEMERIEASSKGGVLPSYLRAEAKLYECTSSLSLELRLSLITASGAPGFRLRIVGHDTAKEEVAAEVVSRVKNELSDFRVYVGAVSQRT